MSRSGYAFDLDNWDLIRYRGAVKSALRGRRGQRMLRDLVDALDALPRKRLIEHDFVRPDGEVCALGALANARGIPMMGPAFDKENEWSAGALLGRVFDIADSLANEVMFENDERCFRSETPEERWKRMREWAVSHLRAEEKGR